MSKPRRRYERLGGDRPGRNVCVSGRITDAQDDKIDILAEANDTTRSKILSDAVGDYLKKHYHKNTTTGLFDNSTAQATSSTNECNTDLTSIPIVIQKDEYGLFMGVLPSFDNRHVYGVTLEELFIKLRRVIQTDEKQR